MNSIYLRMLNKLIIACSRFSDFGESRDLWEKGCHIITKRTGLKYYLSAFSSSDLIPGEHPEATITIQLTEERN